MSRSRALQQPRIAQLRQPVRWYDGPVKEGASHPAIHDRGDGPATTSAEPVFVKVDDVRPEGYDGTCLRPLGLCELGGCCDTCWYRPDHPRFRRG